MRTALLAVCLLACSRRTPDADLRHAAEPSSARQATVVDAAADASPRAVGPADGGVRADAGPAEPDPLTAPGSVSTSIGSPNDGRLEGGIPLPPEGPGFLHNPNRTNSEARWGTVEMVRGLVGAAAVVHEELPGGRLVINDLGLREGGPIPHHGSHRNGRDVDVLFYLVNTEGEPLPSKGVPLDPRGRGWDFEDLETREDDVRVRIDLARTWRFLQALAEDPDAGLQRIFVVEHLRTLLVEHARRRRAPRAVVDRVGEAMCQPRMPHDDHLHIRFFCAAGDIAAGCEDTYPIYWSRRQALRAKGVEPVRAKLRPGRPRSKTVSQREARRRAGKMHWRVRDFLSRREVWSKKPSPGRTWCP